MSLKQSDRKTSDFEVPWNAFWLTGSVKKMYYHLKRHPKPKKRAKKILVLRVDPFQLPQRPRNLDRFVFPGQQHSKEKVWICSQHFTNNSFMNTNLYGGGFAGRQMLKVEAVQTLKGHRSCKRQVKLLQMSALCWHQTQDYDFITNILH